MQSYLFFKGLLYQFMFFLLIEFVKNLHVFNIANICEPLLNSASASVTHDDTYRRLISDTCNLRNISHNFIRHGVV